MSTEKHTNSLAALGAALREEGKLTSGEALPDRAPPYYDPTTGRCPHGTRYPHECRDGCEDGWVPPSPPAQPAAWESAEGLAARVLDEADDEREGEDKADALDDVREGAAAADARTLAAVEAILARDGEVGTMQARRLLADLDALAANLRGGT